MRFIECYIENFGKLSHFSYHFEEGMNVFCRENGWGKSTFAGFIKAMLYGLGTSRSVDININERLRYLPWQGGSCGGSLTFSVEDRTYRVERTFGSNAYKDTFCLYDCHTGQVSHDYSVNLGEELFDIDAAGYERSTFISERLTADVHADYTGIQAKLVDMNDLFDYQTAEKALEKRRKHYYLQNGRGAISIATTALNERRAERVKAEEALRKTNELNRRARLLDEERSTLENRLRAVHSRMDSSLSIRTEEALAAHKISLEENLSRARQETSACRAYLSAKVPTPTELEEQANNWRLLKDANLPEIKASPLPKWLSLSLMLIGVSGIGAGIALGIKLEPLYFLIAVGGLACLGIGAVLSFMIQRTQLSISALHASRAEHDRVRASLTAFLASYPIVMADEQLHDDGERLWAIRTKIDELRRAMRNEEDATAAYTNFRRLHPALFGDAPAVENAELNDAKAEETRLLAELDRVREARAACEREIAVHASDAGRYTALSQEIEALERQIKDDQKSLDIIRLTQQFLASARTNLTSRYLNNIQERFRAYMRILTEVDRDSIFSDEYSSETYTVTPDFCVNMSKFGSERSADTLSRGGRDLVALCLRFAITDALFEGKKPPLILDDPFINLDDSKIEAAMALLKRVSEERQIFYVACHSSRA